MNKRQLLKTVAEVAAAAGVPAENVKTLDAERVDALVIESDRELDDQEIRHIQGRIRAALDSTPLKDTPVLFIAAGLRLKTISGHEAPRA